jgi:hypothetical protein
MYSPRTTNSQLVRLAKRYNIPLNSICNKDMLADLFPQRGGYIINMQDSTEGSGTHWVGLWLDLQNGNRISCYYDSFGVDPPLDVINFANRYGSKIMYSSEKVIQNINSGYCGQYVINFLWFMSACGNLPVKKRYQMLISQFHDGIKRP